MYKLFLVRYTLLYKQTPKTILETSKTKQCEYTLYIIRIEQKYNDNPPIFFRQNKDTKVP